PSRAEYAGGRPHDPPLIAVANRETDLVEVFEQLNARPSSNSGSHAEVRYLEATAARCIVELFRLPGEHADGFRKEEPLCADAANHTSGRRPIEEADDQLRIDRRTNRNLVNGR